MYRRVLLGVGALALVAGTSVGIASGAASAAPTPVQLSGSITCAVIGVTQFSPTLVNGGSAASTVKVKATLKDCTGDTVQSGLTIKKGKLALVSSTTVTNNCGAVTEGNPLPVLNGEIKWSAQGGKAAPSAVTVGQPAVDYNVNANSITTYLSDASAPSGSFASESATFSGLGSDKSGGTLESSCGSSHGLGTVKFGKSEGVVTGTVTIQEGS